MKQFRRLDTLFHIPTIRLSDHETLPMPTVRMPIISHEALRIQRLRDRAASLGMDFDEYLDMLIEDDYMSYLRWQTRRSEAAR